jgi:hypothetical protein
MALAKTDVRERARLRLNEEGRANRAFESLNELVEKHLTESKAAELYALKQLLLHAIRNQHLMEPIKERRKGLEGVEGY